jgi:hypothetical protein
VAQVLKHLPSKNEALSSNSSTTTKQNKMKQNSLPRNQVIEESKELDTFFNVILC